MDWCCQHRVRDPSDQALFMHNAMISVINIFMQSAVGWLQKISDSDDRFPNTPTNKHALQYWFCMAQTSRQIKQSLPDIEPLVCYRHNNGCSATLGDSLSQKLWACHGIAKPWLESRLSILIGLVGGAMLDKG